MSAASAIVAAACGIARPSLAPASVTVQLLAINDFHGNIEPPTGANGQVNGVPAGGAEFLSTHIARAAAANPNSIVVAAGDLVGAAPLVSSLFHDEPTIEAMNAMHVAVSSVGNHEFDHGARELQRLKRGGCADDGCQGGHRFRGAAFDYLSANVVRADTNVPLFKPTTVRRVGGVDIGFIGETMEDTPTLVSAAGTRGLTFLDEADTANTYATALGRRGVHAIVLLIHQGGWQEAPAGPFDPNGCDGFAGPIQKTVERLRPEIAVVVTGHTHRAYTCRIAGHLVTSAGAFGQMLTQIEMQVDRGTDAVTSASATNHVVTRDVPRDPKETAILRNYSPRAEQVGAKAVGSIATDILRRPNRAGESALGDVVADAFLAASGESGGADVAFMNQGGIRADVVANGGGTSRSVSYRDLFAVQPFDNVLTIVTMNGDMIRQLLEEQFGERRPGGRDVLQVSGGLTYRYRGGAPQGEHVEPGSIMIGGHRLEPTDSVRVAAPDFVVDGGGGFRTFAQGTGRVAVMSDLDALVAYFRQHSPVAAGPQNRIVRVD